MLCDSKFESHGPAHILLESSYKWLLPKTVWKLYQNRFFECKWWDSATEQAARGTQKIGLARV